MNSGFTKFCLACFVWAIVTIIWHSTVNDLPLRWEKLSGAGKVSEMIGFFGIFASPHVLIQGLFTYLGYDKDTETPGQS